MTCLDHVLCCGNWPEECELALEKLACYERSLMLKTLVHLTNVMVHYSMITPCMDYPFALRLCCVFSLSASKRTIIFDTPPSLRGGPDGVSKLGTLKSRYWH